MTLTKKSGRLKRDKKAERGMSREEVKEAEEQVVFSGLLKVLSISSKWQVTGLSHCAKR